MSNTILTILPSGLHELVEVHPNFITEIETNKKLYNAIIGPLLDKNDLESGYKYYIYCKIENNRYIGGKNFFMTDIIQKVYSDIYITGQIYVIKKVDRNTLSNITDKDIGNIFNILCHCNEQDVKIKKFMLNSLYNEKNVVSQTNSDPFYSLCSWVCL